jgi:hypothetical protein
MSSRIRQLLLACGIAAIGASAAAAQTPPAAQDRSTTVEFRSITRLPGITLQPGKYVFRLGTPVEKQNLVEIYSTDGTRKIATVLTVDYAGTRSGNAATVVFDKTNPPVLRAWYFPGDTVGREFVYTEDEARTIYATANVPVVWATWTPGDVGRIEVQTVGQAIGQTARTVGEAVKDAARTAADVAQEVWDDIEDNVRLVNPTETRKAAERHLDNAERAYKQLTERLDDAQEAPLKGVGTHLEALEDAFEKDDTAWMSHYTPLLAELDRLVPEGPVGTSGGVTLDASTTAALVSIRAHLKSFHAQAMK